MAPGVHSYVFNYLSSNLRPLPLELQFASQTFFRTKEVHQRNFFKGS